MEWGSEDYRSLTVGERLTFRTWELLSIKMISKVVDELSTVATNEEEEEEQKRCIETDTIKRLIQVFLPKFPTECRLPNNLNAFLIGEFWRPDIDTERTVRMETGSFPCMVADSFWVCYSVVLDSLDPRFEHPSHSGMARIEIVSKEGSEILVDIREKISYDRFCDYFDTESYNGEMDASELNFKDLFSRNTTVDLWRQPNGLAIGLDIHYIAGFGGANERIYKQVDGTWCHAVSDRGLKPPRVGLSFLSEERLKSILQTWTDKGFEIKDLP